MPIRIAGRVRGLVGGKTHPITEARIKAGMTLSVLARKSRVPYVTIWRIEQGRVKASTDTILKISRILPSLLPGKSTSKVTTQKS